MIKRKRKIVIGRPGKLIKKGRYMYIIDPTHPNATEHGYVLAHRLVMEKHIGRLLNDDEVVHHVDENRFNNDLSNLQLMTRREHTKLHNDKRKVEDK